MMISYQCGMHLTVNTNPVIFGHFSAKFSLLETQLDLTKIIMLSVFFKVTVIVSFPAAQSNCILPHYWTFIIDEDDVLEKYILK